MGADQSIPDDGLDSSHRIISNAAAIDAVHGQLGRGQLIDSQGSDLIRSTVWRQQIEALLSCNDDTLCQPVPGHFHFNMDARLADARAALKESRVADARYRLVPYKLSESRFWRAIFWRLECAQIELDGEGCLSPAFRRPTKAVHAALTPTDPPDRQPLLARVHADCNAVWEGSAGSPGDCQRGGLFTPNGTSLHGYDEFGG